tara:strand:- start:144 stop:329 length:186 start_codon:yes stop_codon:yes gene_type:complete
MDEIIKIEEVLENGDEVASDIFSQLIDENYNIEEISEVLAKLGVMLVSYAEMQDELFNTVH